MTRLGQISLSSRRQLVLIPLIAIGVSAFVYHAIRALSYYPDRWPFLITGAIVAACLINPRTGVSGALLFILPAISHVSIELGTIYAVLCLLLIASTGDKLVSAFFLLSLVVLGAWLPLATYLLFAVPLLAGLIFGDSAGALLGLLAALTVQVIGMITGKGMIGVVFTGGSQPLYTSVPPVASLTDMGWLRQAWSNLRFAEVLYRLTYPYVTSPLLLGQLGLWAIAAYFTGRLSSGRAQWERRNALAVGIGSMILLVGYLLAPIFLGDVEVPLALAVKIAVASTVGAFAIYPVLVEANRAILQSG